jgi:hypothetical protein
MELREKLFVLWGNLEEVNSQKLLQASKQKKRPRKRPGNKSPLQGKRPKYNDMGRPVKKGEDVEDVEGSSDEGDSKVAQAQGTGKLFEACVKEYGVRDASGKWVRVHRLTGTAIV